MPVIALDAPETILWAMSRLLGSDAVVFSFSTKQTLSDASEQHFIFSSESEPLNSQFFPPAALQSFELVYLGPSCFFPIALKFLVGSEPYAFFIMQPFYQR